MFIINDGFSPFLINIDFHVSQRPYTVLICNIVDMIDFFTQPTTVAHKQYEALRTYYVENIAGQEVARRFGYTYRAFTSLVSTFREKFNKNTSSDLFFVKNTPGRKVAAQTQGAKSMMRLFMVIEAYH